MDDLKEKIMQNYPKIMAGFSAAGYISSTFLAILGTRKAMILIETEERKLGRELTNDEKAKLVWKCYIPTIVTLLLSSAAMGLAFKDIWNRYATLAVAYGLSETRLREVFAEIRKEFGEEKEQQIRTAVMANEFISVTAAAETTEEKQVLLPKAENGDKVVHCIDAISRRKFDRSRDFIVAAVNDFNENVMGVYGRGALNVLYSRLGLDELPIGYDIGWNYENSGDVTLMFSWIDAGDGTPLLVMDFYNPPVYQF